MLKIAGLTVVLTFSCVTAALAQKTEPPGTQPAQSANKDASPQETSGAVDKNVLANKLAGAEN